MASMGTSHYEETLAYSKYVAIKKKTLPGSLTEPGLLNRNLGYSFDSLFEGFIALARIMICLPYLSLSESIASVNLVFF